MDAVVGETNVVKQAFHKVFSESPAPIFRAPGRVNLIGEHTDYNLGFVCPIAIDLACFAAVKPSESGNLRVYSQNLDNQLEWPVTDIASLRPARNWGDYVIGVAQELIQLGKSIPSLDVAIYSTVPVGSGLSSSAAIEVCSALSLLFGVSIDKTELAKLCRRAENNFVGVPVGIMDQYVSVFGEQDRAIKIDCRSLTHETARLPREHRLLSSIPWSSTSSGIRRIKLAYGNAPKP